MLNREIPFLRLLIPFCGGIVSGLIIKPEAWLIVISLLILAAGFPVSLIFNKRQLNHLYGILLTSSMFLCGLLLYANEKNQLSILESEKGHYICTLMEFPEPRPNSFRTIARLHARVDGGDTVSLNGSLMIYFRKDPFISTLLPGDIIKLECQPLPVVNRGNPHEFDYKFYLENNGIKYYSFSRKNDILSHSRPEKSRLRYRALIIRERIIGMYRERGISDDRIGLVAALTLGQKNLLDPEQKQIFIRAGVMHIMAVSGLHAVILSMFILNMLFFLKGRLEFIRILIAVVLLWGFAFVTGLTPSVLRAALMFSFLQAGKLMKRDVNSINSVLASAVILLIARPSVLFDAGFQLSYCAVIFIICFYRSFYLKIRLKNYGADKIWQSAAVTIIAQTGTLPLTISLFNRFPVWFILTNIIIVPLSSVVVIIGCLVPLTYPVEFISHHLALLMDYLTGLTEVFTEKAASLPFASIENIGMVPTESFLLSIFIFLFTMSLLNRKAIPLRIPLIALLILAGAGSIRRIHDRVTGELIVYNGISESQVGIRTGRTLNIWSESDTLMPEAARHSMTRGLNVNNIHAGPGARLIETGYKRILICGHLTKILLQKTLPDIVVLKGKYPSIDMGINPDEIPETIVTGSEVSAGSLNINDAWKSRSHIHNVSTLGACRLKL
ncbi:MAG: ComEC/Rec2 family competence protein [Bacteroidales bacterium]|nr:ComEC/Rec2 family competence protein [Bacteroidales bacterium]